MIDYTKEDFTKLPQRYDVILECVGNKSLSELRGYQLPRRKMCLVGGPHDPSMLDMLGSLLNALVFSAFASKKVVMFIAKSSARSGSAVNDCGREVEAGDRQELQLE